jgi:hypothetical protein
MGWSVVNHAGARPAPSAELTPGLADEFLETYLWWREESAALQLAYDRWLAAAADDTADAYAAFRAALDLEERAAAVFGACAGRISAAA